MKMFLILTMLVGGAAFAHQGATGIVLERMEGMKSIGAAVKFIAPMMTGNADFDPAIATEAANAIIAHSGQNMIDRFPHGSDGGVSEAAANIWDDPEGFAAIAFKLEELAAAIPLEDASAEDRLTLFNDIGQTCKDCHADYRISK